MFRTKAYKRFNYKFLTDYWVILFLVVFYILLKLHFAAVFLVGFYAPVVLSGIKILWTKTSNVKIFKDKLIFHHKELPTYLRDELKAENIKKIIFKTFSFSFGESEYCLISRKSLAAKEVLINLSRFSRSKELKNEIKEFAQKHKIPVKSF